MKRNSILIILPALNEEESVGKVIDEIPKQALEKRGFDVKIVVADNNSVDRTRQIAQDKGVDVVVEPRRGKGRVMRKAFSQFKADFVFMIDADYTYPASYITRMLDILEEGSPIVIGSRLRGKIEEGGMSYLNRLGNYLLTWIARALYRRGISDLCTGYWGFRGEIIPKLELLADGFTLEAELFADITKRGYKIAEIPIHYRRRRTPPKLNSLRDGIKIGWALLKRRFRGSAGR
ncbi:MAG: glycosyltransferase [Chloroflexota bacterium]|nr:MAG: glycosyltransferase [Chloroflexota bacterium]